MLKRSEQVPHNSRHARRLWHDSERHTPSLGCINCRERSLCGGLSMKAAFYDCMQFCCGNPGSCDRVCRNNPDFADRVREIGRFELDNVPRADGFEGPELPDLVPVVFHGRRRAEPFPAEVVALPFFEMFDRTGRPRWTEHEPLCRAFGLSPGSVIVLTGTDQDPPLERWWRFGAEVRRPIVEALKAADVKLVTTPNYSTFLDRPRWDDMHSMKRIAISHQKFMEEGLLAALHVNGRTDRDFERWAAYLSDRPEITHLSYEFTTGTGWPGRREQHAAWLTGLAHAVGRPLQLVVRGGAELRPLLLSAFARVTVLETSVFMKTMMRRRAVRDGASGLTWQKSPTPVGAPLDELIADNWMTVSSWFGSVEAPSISEGLASA